MLFSLSFLVFFQIAQGIMRFFLRLLMFFLYSLRDYAVFLAFVNVFFHVVLDIMRFYIR